MAASDRMTTLAQTLIGMTQADAVTAITAASFVYAVGKQDGQNQTLPLNLQRQPFISLNVKTGNVAGVACYGKAWGDWT